MGRAIRLLATTSIASFALLTGCGDNLPTDPLGPKPTPMPIPTPLPTPAPDQIAATFATKMDTVFKNTIASWRDQATISGVVVNGSEGQAKPGAVKGPSLSSFFAAELVKVSGSTTERRIMNLFANAATKGFSKWQSSFTTTLIYPGFDSVQAPQAAPTANWPQKLSVGTADDDDLKSDALATAVRMAFPDASATESKAIDAAATKLAARFQSFVAGTTIRDVIGSGAVPAYDPPFVPAGPVVNGRAAGEPGQVFK